MLIPSLASCSRKKSDLSLRRQTQTVSSTARQILIEFSIDHQRWDGIPVTYKTNWYDAGGINDIRTCVLIHDAIEREFNIDIDDRKILLQSIEDCFNFIMANHNAL
jgi:hypothetical protein